MEQVHHMHIGIGIAVLEEFYHQLQFLAIEEEKIRNGRFIEKPCIIYRINPIMLGGFDQQLCSWGGHYGPPSGKI